MAGGERANAVAAEPGALTCSASAPRPQPTTTAVCPAPSRRRSRVHCASSARGSSLFHGGGPPAPPLREQRAGLVAVPRRRAAGLLRRDVQRLEPAGRVVLGPGVGHEALGD